MYNTQNNVSFFSCRWFIKSIIRYLLQYSLSHITQKLLLGSATLCQHHLNFLTNWVITLQIFQCCQLQIILCQFFHTHAVSHHQTLGYHTWDLWLHFHGFWHTLSG